MKIESMDISEAELAAFKRTFDTLSSNYGVKKEQVMFILSLVREIGFGRNLQTASCLRCAADVIELFVTKQ